MDAQEKRVVRWKRHLVASSVTWNDDFVAGLRERNLLSDVVQSQIQAEATSYSRVSRYLELLVRGVETAQQDVFQSLCDVISDVSKQPWIAEELRTELKTEQGLLVIDDYIRKEAAQLVHRYYGTTRRLSEAEKRRMETIIATRTQCTKDVWKRNLDAMSQTLEQLRGVSNSSESELSAGLAAVRGAVDQQWKAFSSGSRTASLPANRQVRSEDSNKESRSDSLTASVPTDDNSSVPSQSSRQPSTLADEADEICRLTELWTEERAWLQDERRRVLAALGLRDAVVQHLDVEVQSAVQRLSRELGTAKDRLAAAEQRAAALEERMRTHGTDAEEELKARDRTIRMLSSDLEHAEREAEVAQSDTKEMKKQVEMMKVELAKYNVRFRCLEKSRHLGYIQPGTSLASENTADKSHRSFAGRQTASWR